MGKILEKITARISQIWQKISTHIKMSEAEKITKKISSKKPISRNTMNELQKTRDKEKILTAARDMTHYLLGKKIIIWITADFSSEIMAARKKWHDIFQVQKKEKKKNSASGKTLKSRHSQTKENQWKCSSANAP